MVKMLHMDANLHSKKNRHDTHTGFDLCFTLISNIRQTRS